MDATVEADIRPIFLRKRIQVHDFPSQKHDVWPILFQLAHNDYRPLTLLFTILASIEAILP